MKYYPLVLFLFVAMAGVGFAQIPQGIPYQAIARNGQGQVLANLPVEVRFSVIDDTANGTVVYAETHALVTSAQGLFNTNIGLGIPLEGTFGIINWGLNAKFLKVELDTTATGNSYVEMGTQQIMSVPYAFWSGNGVPSGGQQGFLITMCNGVPVWTSNGRCPGTVTSLDCETATVIGTLYAGYDASELSISINYTGGNGGEYSAQSDSSSGVEGLVATIPDGNLSNGPGVITLSVSGTPIDTGLATFNFNLGNSSCTLSIPVLSAIIDSLQCEGIVWAGSVVTDDSASGVIGTIYYYGGNGAPFQSQSISSSGITGLTCFLEQGDLAFGSGSISLSISGITSDTGTAVFNFNFCGQACSFNILVNPNPISTATCGAFKVLNPQLNYGNVTDQQGNNYKTILIGDQEWMAENLRTDRYQNGELIPEVTDVVSWNGLTSGAYCWYGNDSITYNCPYGKLYNWYVISGSRNVCPTGWHVPTLSDWNSVFSVGGTALASSGPYWTSWGSFYGNTTGLSILPGGLRLPWGDYSSNGSWGYIWMNNGSNVMGVTSYPYSSYSSGFSTNHALSIRCLKSGPGSVSVSEINCPDLGYIDNLYSGNPVQNILSGIGIPYQGGNGGFYGGETVYSTGVGGLTAYLSPGVLNIGSGILNYVINGTPYDTGYAHFNISVAGQSCSFSLRIRGLSIDSFDCANVILPSTVIYSGFPVSNYTVLLPYSGGSGAQFNANWFYSYNSYGLVAYLNGGTLATGSGLLMLNISGTPNSLGAAIFTIYLGGQNCTFSIPVSDPTPLSNNSCGTANIHNPYLTYGTMIDQDSNQYKTVFISGQEWMAENLRAFRYSNGDTINEVTDGGLWNTMTMGAVSSLYNNPSYDCDFGKLYNWYAASDPRNVCPVGWRVPNYWDFNNLINQFGSNPISLQANSYWQVNYYNNIYLNNSGFSAMPSGYRNWDGSYYNFYHSGNWWSNTSTSPNTASYYLLSYGNVGSMNFSSVTSEKTNGFSIRCVR